MISLACNGTGVLSWEMRENSRGGYKDGNISLLKHSAGRHYTTGSYLYGRRLENHFLLSLATTEPYKLYGYGWSWPTASRGDVAIWTGRMRLTPFFFPWHTLFLLSKNRLSWLQILDHVKIRRLILSYIIRSLYSYMQKCQGWRDPARPYVGNGEKGKIISALN